MVWYSHVFKNFPQFAVIPTVKGFSIVSEADLDVSLEFGCFFYDPMNVGNLTSDSSDLSKSSKNIWKFLVHILLKPTLKDFEPYRGSMGNECSCIVFEHSFALPFFEIQMKTDIFQSCGHCSVSKFASMLCAAL